MILRDKSRGFRQILIILIALLVGYYFGVNKIDLQWKNYKPSFSVVNKQPPASVSEVDFSLFWIAWNKLESSYYDKSKLDSKKMLNGAISGMVQSVGDPYTVYLPPVQTKNFKEGLAGQFSGIGAELGVSEEEEAKDQKIIVISPLVGSPAQKAGILAGDTILKVDGASTVGWTLPQAVEKIRGPKGTTVTLTLLHKGAKEPKDLKIVRDVITVKSVDGEIKKIKGVSIAYIRLSQFGDPTNKEWLSMVNTLNLAMRKEGNVKGIVLDLRNNPGGYLTDAVFIASEFLDQNDPVVLEEDGNGKRTTLSVTRKGLFTDEIPLAILINKGSASASEIVSGAIRDNKKNGKSRGILVGETSFGKGTIQQAEDFENGGSIHVTIAKWLTPNGIWVNEKGGLTPDVIVALDTKDPSRDAQLEKAVEELVK